MFICDRCHKVTEPYETCNKVVVETRYKTYHNIRMVGKPPMQNEKHFETKGMEIAKEESLCTKCYLKETIKVEAVGQIHE